MTQTITLTFSLTLELPDGVTIETAPTVSPKAAAVVAQLPPPIRAVPDPPVDGRTSRLGPLQRSLLQALASRHGRLADPQGRATIRLAELAEAPAARAATMAVQKLEERGLIERTMLNSRRTSRIVLTAEGWAAIGQTPPHSSGIDTTSAEPAAAEPDGSTPLMPDLGPIGKRAFDPDDVRRRQAELV